MHRLTFSYDLIDIEVIWWLESQSCPYTYNRSFLYVGSKTEMERNSHQNARNRWEEDLVSWEDQETLDIVGVFSGKGGLDHVFTEVGPFSSWRVLLSEGGKVV